MPSPPRLALPRSLHAPYSGTAWRRPKPIRRSKRSSASNGPGSSRAWPGWCGTSDLAEELAQDAARDRPVRMAEDRGPAQSRRLADGRGQAPGHRRVPPQQDAGAQARRDRPGPRDETRYRASRTIEAAMDDDVGDELLGLIFTACHPVLSTEARVALTLRLIGGLTTDEIARAFLSSEATIAQRIVRAKKTLGNAGLTFEVPRGKERERAPRLGAGGHLPDLQRGLCGHRRRGPDPPGPVRRGAAPGPHPRRPDARRAGGLRSPGADGNPGLASGRPHGAGRLARSR